MYPKITVKDTATAASLVADYSRSINSSAQYAIEILSSAVNNQDSIEQLVTISDSFCATNCSTVTLSCCKSKSLTCCKSNTQGFCPASQTHFKSLFSCINDYKIDCEYYYMGITYYSCSYPCSQ